MTDTQTPVADALAEVDQAGTEYGVPSAELLALRKLADAVRSHGIGVELGQLREQRTTAPPAPDVTQNAGYTVCAVLPGHPASPGLLRSWYVAAQDERGAWVTWEAYELDGPRAGRLAYNTGHYYDEPGRDNRRAALADLAKRAGIAHVAPSQA